MAAKATIADVTNEGFQAVNFGSPSTFATAGGIIDTLLTRASNWASTKVTAANYAATTTGYVFDCLLRAEVAYVSQVLWLRRVAFLDGSATVGLESDKKATLLQKARDLADDAQCDQTFWIGEAQRALGLDVQADIPGTGASTGIIETGMMPQTITAARNYGGAQ